MLRVRDVLRSTLGQKFLMAATGLALMLFVVAHLLGNLTLLMPDGTAFNMYANQLHTLGVILKIAEVSLSILAILHIFLAIRLKYLALRARPTSYDGARTKMGPSKMSYSSRNLIITGFMILFFLVIHIIQFKYGAAQSEGYVVNLQGHAVRDLYRLVRESFHQPVTVGFYILSLVFLALHLKHGFWSSFQSLGATRPGSSNAIYYTGIVFSILLFLGYTLIPVSMYFDLPQKLFGGGQ